MNDEEVKTLFEALSHIMSQNQKIKRHLGISKYDSEWGWDDDYSDRIISECDSIARDHYEHDNDEV